MYFLYICVLFVYYQICVLSEMWICPHVYFLTEKCVPGAMNFKISLKSHFIRVLNRLSGVIQIHDLDLRLEICARDVRACA